MLLIAAATLMASVAPTSANATTTEVWLLAGQSNMSGRGDLAELTEAERKPEGVLLYGNDGVLRPAVEPLDSAAGQLDPVSADAAAAVGPGLAFARARLQGRSGLRLVLVPCAKGGSAITAWAPSPGRETLFGSCVARAREASAYGRVRGILWYQGETDARTLEAAGAWQARFSAVVSGFRRYLRRRELPVIVVSLADPPPPRRDAYPGWSLIQRSQQAMRGAGLVAVSAAGLPMQPDGLHLSTTAQRDLGARLAAGAEVVAPVRRPRVRPPMGD